MSIGRSATTQSHKLKCLKYLEYRPAVKPSIKFPRGKPAMQAAVKAVICHGLDSSQGWFRKTVREAFPNTKISHHGSTTELVIRMSASEFALAKSNTAKCRAGLLAQFEVAAQKPAAKQQTVRRLCLPLPYNRAA